MKTCKAQGENMNALRQAIIALLPGKKQESRLASDPW
jgi:hypothetical protein